MQWNQRPGCRSPTVAMRHRLGLAAWLCNFTPCCIPQIFILIAVVIRLLKCKHLHCSFLSKSLTHTHTHMYFSEYLLNRPVVIRLQFAGNRKSYKIICYNIRKGYECPFEMCNIKPHSDPSSSTTENTRINKKIYFICLIIMYVCIGLLKT